MSTPFVRLEQDVGERDIGETVDQVPPLHVDTGGRASPEQDRIRKFSVGLMKGLGMNTTSIGRARSSLASHVRRADGDAGGRLSHENSVPGNSHVSRSRSTLTNLVSILAPSLSSCAQCADRSRRSLVADRRRARAKNESADDQSHWEGRRREGRRHGGDIPGADRQLRRGHHPALKSAARTDPEQEPARRRRGAPCSDAQHVLLPARHQTRQQGSRAAFRGRTRVHETAPA